MITVELNMVIIADNPILNSRHRYWGKDCRTRERDDEDRRKGYELEWKELWL